MKLQTVNVIEMFSGILDSIHSFTDNASGNKEAEKLSELVRATSK